MTTRHIFQNDVQMRSTNEKETGNCAGRPSKVSSMIQRFSFAENNSASAKTCRANSPTTQRTQRIASAVETKDNQQQEVFVETNDVKRPIYRRQSPVSIGLRVPRPFICASARNAEKEASSAKPLFQARPEAATQEKQKLDQSTGQEKAKSALSGILGRRISAQNVKKEVFQTKPTTRTQFGEKNSVPVGTMGESPLKMNCQLDNGEGKSGQTFPNFNAANGFLRAADATKISKSDDRRISNARNYWEHKIEPTNGATKRGVTPDSSSRRDVPSPKNMPGFTKPKDFITGTTERTKSDNPGQNSPKSSANAEISKSVVADRARNFGNVSPKKPTTSEASSASSDRLTFSSPKLRPKSDYFRTPLKPYVPETPEKPEVPTRPRFMTSAAGLRSKGFQSPQESKIPSSLHGIQTSPSRRNAANLETKSSPLLVKPPAASPRQQNKNRLQNGDSAPPRPPRSPISPRNFNDRSSNVVVNPLPKPERTFTFSTADLTQPSIPMQKLRHRNIARVSSDRTTLSGPGISASLSKIFGGSTPDISTRTPKEGYEEVTLFEPKGGRSQTMCQQPNVQKWQKQHNYEEVENTISANENNAANYDHINLAPPSPRSLTLDDLNDSYSHLMFKQDLHMTQTQKPLSLIDAPHFHHMKLKKQNSDMSDVVSRNSDESSSKSEKSLESGLLQITDKIRETFTQISKKYRHHRKVTEENDDAKSISSSGDEDSDTETDFNKHRQTLDRVRTYQKTYRKTLKYKSLERDLSQCEQSTLFEQMLICKIVEEQDGKSVSKVSYRFPRPDPGKNIGDEKTLAHFCFPDIDVIEPCSDMPSQSYSFMLTREDGTRKFGYCRRILPPGGGLRYPVVYCLISPLGSFGLYELILDELELRHRVAMKRVTVLLEALQVERFPSPGKSVTVEIFEPDGVSNFILRRPYDTRLEHVDLQCLLSEIGVENTIKIFASLLLERRVIICGTSLSILTACIHAFRALLYPFVWQHVFVPVLPPPMIDLCCSPTPLLIGILETSLERLKTLPLEEVFIFNLSTQEVVSSMGDELEILPRKLQTPLINSLGNYASDSRGLTSEPNYDFAIDYVSAERNTIISESFMHLFVEMIGHYQHHFQPVMQATNAQSGRFGRIYRNFNRVSFYEDVMSRSLRRFLDLFMGTQMFDGFIHSRELASPDYEGLFERRVSYHLRNADASQLNFKDIKTKMKKIMLGIGKKK